MKPREPAYTHFFMVTCAAVLTWGGVLTLETPNILIVGCEGGEDRLEIRSVELSSYALNSVQFK